LDLDAFPKSLKRLRLPAGCAVLRGMRLGIALSLILSAGCQLGQKGTVGLPTRHSIRSTQLLVLSDFKLPDKHPLIEDLIELRQQVAQTLDLPLQSETVVVYLFRDELTYYQYLQTAHPGLPSRRAYFIATPKELAVYTYWGNRIQEDLRHEYTHGLLHAGLQTVPLWLDEGLAEYFEVAGPTPGGVNPEYARKLSQAIENGWQPDMERLERLERVDQMHRPDYTESWAWVHFMLNSSPDTRQILLTYLHELRTNSHPEVLSKRLAREVPDLSARLLSYLATLNTFQHAAGAGSGAGAG
jgi:hypothetical protein